MTEPKVNFYPIPGNDTGGVLHIYGKPNAQNVILYCGGFPDDHQAFTPLARRLAGDDCFVGITCFPGFDYSLFKTLKFDGYRRQGYSFNDVAVSIREAAKHLFLEYNSGREEEGEKPQFTCIFHDWGVVAGSIFVNLTIEDGFSLHVPDRVVFLDVLMWPHKKYQEVPTQDEVSYPLNPSRRDAVFSLSYRFALASGFAVMRYISEFLGVITLVILYGIIIAMKLNPTVRIDNKLVEDRKISPFHLVFMSYPYFYMFQSMCSKTGFEHATIPLDLKKIPVLYIYGTEKKVMFHDKRSLAILEREEREGRSESRVVKMENAGHWMYVQKLEDCFVEIKSFLNGSKKRGSIDEGKSKL